MNILLIFQTFEAIRVKLCPDHKFKKKVCSAWNTQHLSLVGQYHKWIECYWSDIWIAVKP